MIESSAVAVMLAKRLDLAIEYCSSFPTGVLQLLRPEAGMHANVRLQPVSSARGSEPKAQGIGLRTAYARNWGYPKNLLGTRILRCTVGSSIDAN